MAVELQDLRWAITASQHRSLRQAAERLNIRQSTLSRRLSDLEDRLGTVLFERTNGGTRPTAAGRDFLETARRIIDEMDTAFSRLKTCSHGASGRLTIGIHASLSTGNLRATLIEHRRRFPDVEIYAVDGPSRHLISDLASDVIDVAIVITGSTSWDDRSLPLWSERVIVALPEQHPLSSQKAIQWDELANERLLLPQRGPGPEFHKLLTAKLGWSKLCGILYQDVGLDRLLTLVGAECGSLLALEGATGAAYPGVAYREIHDGEGPTRLHFTAYWRQTNGNPTLGPFLDLLRERYPDLSGMRPPD